MDYGPQALNHRTIRKQEVTVLRNKLYILGFHISRHNLTNKTTPLDIILEIRLHLRELISYN